MKDKAKKKEYLRRHWILWNWLAENPECGDKDGAFIALGWRPVEWPWDENIDLTGPNWPDNDCYLCEVYMTITDNNGDSWSQDVNCNDCPLSLTGNGCNAMGGYYSRWLQAGTPKTRKKYAALIRDVVPKPEDIEEPKP
jgi:hypothetical protein